MTEIQEMAQAIHEKHKALWPLTWAVADFMAKQLAGDQGYLIVNQLTHELMGLNTEPVEPAPALDPKDLRIDTYSSKPLPQWLHHTITGVRVIHLPTGLEAICETERSQHANKDKALAQLTRMVAGKQQPAQDELLPDKIHQMAFEEGQPAEDGDGYLFTAEEFDLFVERLLSRAALSAPVAQTALSAERDRLRDEIEALRGQLAESQANYRTAMGYLSDVRQIVGGDDFPSMVANVARMAEIRCEGCGYMTHHREHMGCVRAAMAAKEASDEPS